MTRSTERNTSLTNNSIKTSHLVYWFIILCSYTMLRATTLGRHKHREKHKFWCSCHKWLVAISRYCRLQLLQFWYPLRYITHAKRLSHATLPKRFWRRFLWKLLNTVKHEPRYCFFSSQKSWISVLSDGIEVWGHLDWTPASLQVANNSDDDTMRAFVNLITYMLSCSYSIQTETNLRNECL